MICRPLVPESEPGPLSAQLTARLSGLAVITVGPVALCAPEGERLSGTVGSLPLQAESAARSETNAASRLGIDVSAVGAASKRGIRNMSNVRCRSVTSWLQ